MSGGDGFWQPLPTAGAGGGLLAVHTYRPASNTQYSLPGGSGFSDVDATNLTITFTAPASGEVLVGLNAKVVAVSSEDIYWNLRTTAGADVADSDAIVAFTTGNVQFRVSHRAHVTGLTSGASYTYRWGHGGTGASSSIRIGGPHGAAVMEVWSA